MTHPARPSPQAADEAAGGTTLYAGTIPDSSADPAASPADDAILRMITNLRSGNEPGAPGGSTVTSS